MLNKLKEQAREAQRAYDKALKEQNTKKIPEGILTTASKANGKFEWNCHAKPSQIVGHTISTIKSAFETLETDGDNEMAEMELVIEILSLVQGIAKAKVQ